MSVRERERDTEREIVAEFVGVCVWVNECERERASLHASHNLITLGFGFRVSGFGLRVSGFGFRVSNFEFLVLGFGFRDSGFGCRVSGVGCRM